VILTVIQKGMMSNMSYCRFENTLNDLEDCLAVMEEAVDEGKTFVEFLEALSGTERTQFKLLLSTCRRVLEVRDEMVSNESHPASYPGDFAGYQE
jgi:hypothetical protein